MYRYSDQNNIHKRIKMTAEETAMSKLLNHNKFKDFIFYRHHQIGNYIADFVCEDKKLIIDIFYGFYNSVEDQKEDNIRLNFFKEEGYKVLRIMDKDIEHNIGAVYRQIQSMLNILPKENADLVIKSADFHYNFFK